MTSSSRPRVLIDILEEHLDELGFLWEQREDVVLAPDWSLSELAQLEARADRHIPGLALGSEHTLDLARPLLESGDRSAAIAATFALLGLNLPGVEDAILAALTGESADGRHGARIALRHSGIRRLLPRLEELVSVGAPAARLVALDVLAFHRAPSTIPWSGLPVPEDPEDVALIWSSVGRLGGPWTQEHLEHAFRHEEERVHRIALETSARVGLPGLLERCRREVAAGDPSPRAAVVEFLGVIGNAGDLPRLQALAHDPSVAAPAMSAIGAIGDPAAVPFLIGAMERPELAGAAGSAFVRLTGATDIEAAEPLPPPAGASGEDEELHIEVFPPDPRKAAHWWERERARFGGGARWQSGRAIGTGALSGPVFNQLPLAFRRDVYLGERSRDIVTTPDLELERRATLQLAPGPDRG